MDGILIINKPKGFTSQDAVSKVKKILNIKKAGHTGTLDPMATGVLPILLGNYTKLSKYLIEHDKTYIAEIKLGLKTDTGDIEGNVIKESVANIENITYENVNSVLKSFLGKQMQVPPMYSAIKINGKKLYEYAREGKTIERKPREIEIYDIKLISFTKEDEAKIKFEVTVSKGTYIRVLCEDIAEKLNTCGTMSSLIRVKLDKFDIENAIDLNVLEENKNNKEFLDKKIIKMETLFNNLGKIILEDRKQELFLNGVMLTFKLEDGIYNIYTKENTYLGLGIIKNNLLKRDVII